MTEEKRESGLIVVTQAEKDAQALLQQMEAMATELRPRAKRILRWAGVRHHKILDIDIKTEARMETPHKLNEEQRKQRREDNKAMRKLRAKRGRRKHGHTR